MSQQISNRIDEILDEIAYLSTPENLFYEIR